MTARRALISVVQRIIEDTYDLDTGSMDASGFVIGDAGLAEIYAHRTARGRSLEKPSGAMLLVRSDDTAHHVRIYYPDRVIANLERHDPARGINDENLADFCTFVEELDHLLFLVNRWRARGAACGLELELHANVTKILVSSLFLARTQGRSLLTPEQRATLRWRLLERSDFRSEEPWLRERYLTASRQAVKFLNRLDRTPRPTRPALLRRFSRSPLPDKLRMCG